MEFITLILTIGVLPFVIIAISDKEYLITTILLLIIFAFISLSIGLLYIEPTITINKILTDSYTIDGREIKFNEVVEIVEENIDYKYLVVVDHTNISVNVLDNKTSCLLPQDKKE